MRAFDRWRSLFGGTIITGTVCAFACDLSWVGDGYCDGGNNDASCGGYDGGDCCACTCIDEVFDCGTVGFNCIDPEAACVDEDGYVPLYNYYYTDDTSYTSATCLPTLAGDGLCDSTQNNAECGYDGGDCCDCTCVDAVFECGVGGFGFDCLDPAAACEDEEDYTNNPYSESSEDDGTYSPSYSESSASGGADGFSCASEGISRIGDGLCDLENNNEGCGYDGGDCCECTCVDAANDCGTDSFSCVDPEAWCVEEDDDSAGGCEDAKSCLDVANKSLSNTDSSSRKVARLTAITIVTVISMIYMCCTHKRHRNNNDLVHSKLLSIALIFSLAEGVSLYYLVPESKERLKILVVFLFGFVSALSEFFLRRATRSYVRYAVSNLVLEGAFAAVLLFFFVEQTTDNYFLFGGFAGNEALVGFAITCCVDDRPTGDDSERANIELVLELAFIVTEAAVDGCFPLLYRELLKPSFHPDSAWRSDIVFTAWSFFGMANIALAALYSVSPVNNLNLGTKLKYLVQGCLLSGGFGIMSFVVLGIAEEKIENPPAWDTAWSCLTGASGVLVALTRFVSGIPRSEAFPMVKGPPSKAWWTK